MKLLSIVIVNFNYGRYLADAIRSIVNQMTDEVELVIIDGGSTDNSVEVIKSFTDNLPPGTALNDSNIQTFKHSNIY